MRLVCLFLLFILNDLSANPDSLKAVQLLDAVRENIENNKLADIKSDTKKALSILKQQDDLDNWLNEQIKLGKTWRSLHNYQRCISTFDSALENMWRQPTKRELNRIASLTGLVGHTYYKKLNNLELALPYYKKYETLYRDSINSADIHVARFVYNPMGNIYDGLRDQAKAMHYFSMALEVSKRELDWNLFRKASTNLARTHRTLEHPYLATKVIEESSKYLDSMAIGDQINFTTKAGRHYYHLKDYKKAYEYTEQANHLFKKYTSNFHKNTQANFLYDFYFNYGRIAKGEMKYKQAEIFYKKALKLLETELKDGNRRQMVIMHFNFGELYFEQKLFDKADTYFQKATSYLSSILAMYPDPELVPTNSLTGEDLLAYNYQRQGNIAFAQYQTNNELPKLHRAIKFYELADLVGQFRTQNYTSEESKLTSLASQKGLKEDLQFALYELWRVDPQESIRDKIFAISEKSHSLLLLENNELTETISTWDEGSRKIYNYKKIEQIRLEQAIYDLQLVPNHNNQSEINILKKQVLKLNDNLAELQQLKNKASQYSINKTTPIKDIQETLTDSSAIIEYFVGEKHIYTYVLTKTDFNFYREVRTNSYDSTVKELRNSLAKYSNQSEAFGVNASKLYDLILKKPLGDISQKVKQLLIVKDHHLHFIPFDILLTQPFEKDMHFANMPYLLKKYSISCQSSVSLFINQMGVRQTKAKKIFAGYAPQYKLKNIAQEDTLHDASIAMLTRSGNFELKGAQKEVELINDYLNGKPFLGQDASESNFKKSADKYKIILLSMHGIANQDNPYFSQLLFTKGASGNEDDDLLKPIEISNMKLNANLVVLSACETGFGKLYPGEGVFSFSRAFFSAGVPSTLMTLWKVEDKSTSEIIINFFTFLDQGLSKDEALRQAKLMYLQDNKNNKAGLHPYFWSGLLISGNTEALDLSSGVPFQYFLLPLLFLVSIFSFRFFLKKVNNWFTFYTSLV